VVVTAFCVGLFVYLLNLPFSSGALLIGVGKVMSDLSPLDGFQVTAARTTIVLLGAMIRALVSVLPASARSPPLRCCCLYVRAAAGRCADHACRHLLRRAVRRSTTSVLVNIPGEATSVIASTEPDGPARPGGPALAIAAIGSFFAGCVATVPVAVGAPLTHRAAVRAGRYFR
jgi:hypothetical protein